MTSSLIPSQADYDLARRLEISTQRGRGEAPPGPVNVQRLRENRECNVAGSKAQATAAANATKLNGWSSMR